MHIPHRIASKEHENTRSARRQTRKRAERTKATRILLSFAVRRSPVGARYPKRTMRSARLASPDRAESTTSLLQPKGNQKNKLTYIITRFRFSVAPSVRLAFFLSARVCVCVDLRFGSARAQVVFPLVRSRDMKSRTIIISDTVVGNLRHRPKRFACHDGRRRKNARRARENGMKFRRNKMSKHETSRGIRITRIGHSPGNKERRLRN